MGQNDLQSEDSEKLNTAYETEGRHTGVQESQIF